VGAIARRAAFAAPTLPHVATFRPRLAGSAPSNAERPPDTEASCGEGTTVAVRYGYARLNLPRSVLRKRDWSFLILISRVSAACNVACGVLPAGLVQ
jgi:hypothetical protein